MGITVKIKGLAAWSAKFRDPKRGLLAVAKSQQDEALNLISKGFKSGTDPYGKEWDAPNDLQITGRLRSYTYGELSAGQWQVHATDQKAVWHHAPQMRQEREFARKSHHRTIIKKTTTKSGKVRKTKDKVSVIGTTVSQGSWKLPTRLQVPTPERGLPESWENRLVRSGNAALKAYFED